MNTARESNATALFEAMRSALLPRAIPARPDQTVTAAVKAIVDQGGPSVQAILFFGSRKTRARPDPYSPWDFLVLVAGYPDFYVSLQNAGALRRSPALLWSLNAVMPPNVVALRAEQTASEGRLLLKCPVFSMRDFKRETSGGRRDHFLLGRLFQPAEIVYAADGAVMDEVLCALVRTSLLTFAWGRPRLPERFDVAGYCRTLLRTSFAAEIRPEPSSRTETLWQFQRELQIPVYSTLLAGLRSLGEVAEPEPGVYTLSRPVTFGERLRSWSYFRWSLARATLRWAKHVITFNDWLDFIVRKASRHTGQHIVLTPREKRLPLVFLWPRVFRYLRQKDARGVPQP